MLIFCKELYRDVPYHPIYSRHQVYINDLIVAAEAAEQEVAVGNLTVSGLKFADDFVGISETPEGLQKQREKVVEYTTQRSVTADVKKCAVVVGTGL